MESESRYAVGGLINETPIICGGKDSNRDRLDSCIVFGQTKTYIKMQEKRSTAISVVLNETTLWILGGWNDSGTVSSTELITLDAATSVNGPALPNKLGAYT